MFLNRGLAQEKENDFNKQIFIRTCYISKLKNIQIIIRSVWKTEYQVLAEEYEIDTFTKTTFYPNIILFLKYNTA